MARKIARGDLELKTAVTRRGKCLQAALDFNTKRSERTYLDEVQICSAGLKKAAELLWRNGRGRAFLSLQIRWRVNCVSQSHITAHLKKQARHALAVSQ